MAKFFGSTRTPLSGGNSKITRSDSLHEKIFIETKYKQRHVILDLWDDTAAKAEKEGKLPIVALQQKGRPGFWTLIRSGDLLKLIELMGYVKKL